MIAEIKIYDTTKPFYMPKKAYRNDSGFDLFVSYFNKEIINNKEKTIVGTNTCIHLPKGYAGLLMCRSSIFKTSLRLANGVGLIDSEYQGEIIFIFDSSDEEYIKVGLKIGQIVIIQLPEIELNLVKEFQIKSERNTKGFGSSGL